MPPLRAVKVLDQLRERILLLHYSRRTEEAYVYWCRAFIRWQIGAQFLLDALMAA